MLKHVVLHLSGVEGLAVQAELEGTRPFSPRNAPGSKDGYTYGFSDKPPKLGWGPDPL